MEIIEIKEEEANNVETSNPLQEKTLDSSFQDPIISAATKHGVVDDDSTDISIIVEIPRETSDTNDTEIQSATTSQLPIVPNVVSTNTNFIVTAPKGNRITSTFSPQNVSLAPNVTPNTNPITEMPRETRVISDIATFSPPVQALSAFQIEQRKRQQNIMAMKRPATGRFGAPISLFSNHFRVRFTNLQDAFQYHVCITNESNTKGPSPVCGKEISRKIMDKVKEVYGQTELGNKNFAFDGEKSLFTIGPLPRNNIQFMVVMDLNGTVSVLKGNIASHKAQDALRVLDIVLRQHASQRGYLLLKQSFFNTAIDPDDIGGGVGGIKGYHISFRPTQKGLTLNMDTMTTMVFKRGPVLDFLVQNQNVKDPQCINWHKAKQILKGLRVKASHLNMEFKIMGLSDCPCNELKFSLKKKNKNPLADEPPEIVELSVCKYFEVVRNIRLLKSAHLPCLDVGRRKKPNYLPMELCELIEGQRYTRSLTATQCISLIEKSRQKPEERMAIINKTMQYNDYNANPLLKECTINVDNNMVSFNGRVLQPPMLKFGGPAEETPRNGRWNYNNKLMIDARKIKRWGVANFTSKPVTEIAQLAHELQQCCLKKGMDMKGFERCFTEDKEKKSFRPVQRVEMMFTMLREDLTERPDFLLCVLPERKTSELYGPWKRKCLTEFGVVTQCIAPAKRINDQYLTNVALKINVKMGGLNSKLAVEHYDRIPTISKIPTIILGMDVSHGSPGQAGSPSIASVVASREWPSISKYRASLRTQSPKVEMIEGLFKPTVVDEKTSRVEDLGMINELLREFFRSSKGRKPQKMIIFRDGVSESQFDQVLNMEMQDVLKACNQLENNYRPTITLVIAQKNHHTKLFQSMPGNVQPEAGTIVDTQICHPRNYDFFLCPQAGPIGTSRPTHYHVLVDENQFSVDDLQMLIHALSYVYQRSTTAISSVAPIYYARLAATQMQQVLKREEPLEGGSRTERNEENPHFCERGVVRELPKLHSNVSNHMYFC